MSRFSSLYRMSSFCILFACCIWLIVIFIFNPHFVELTGILETWFPYKGLIPYRDFPAFHFPLGRLILFPLHIITDWKLEADPFLALFIGLGTLVLIYMFGAKFLSSTGTALSVIFFASLYWFSGTGILFFHELLIGFFIALILYILFNSKQKGVTSTDLFALGVLISLTELSGQIASFTLLVIWINIFYYIFKQGKKVIFNSLFYLLGALIPFLILSIYFLLNHSFYEFFYYNITYYLQYSGYKKDLLSLPYKSLVFFYFPLILSIITNIIFFIKFRFLNSKNIFFLALSLSSIPFIIFSVYHPHHLAYALPILSIALGVSFDTVLRLGKGVKIFFWLACFIPIYIFLSDTLPWHLSRIVYPVNFKIANDIYPGDDTYPVIEWLQSYTSQTAKIMVLGDALIYLRSNRLPASRPSKGAPYSWEPFDKVKTELVLSPPDYWIVGKTFTDRIIKNYDNGKTMMDFVDDQLVKHYRLKYEYGVWRVWEKSDSR